jgi:hypothetical protein
MKYGMSEPLSVQWNAFPFNRNCQLAYQDTENTRYFEYYGCEWDQFSSCLRRNDLAENEVCPA